MISWPNGFKLEVGQAFSLSLRGDVNYLNYVKDITGDTVIIEEIHIYGDQLYTYEMYPENVENKIDFYKRCDYDVKEIPTEDYLVIKIEGKYSEN